MNNQVAAPCCGSCQCCSSSSFGHRCYERSPYEIVGLGQTECLPDRKYKPRNPIPIIELPGVRELVEAAWRNGFQEGRGLAGAKYPELYEDNYVFEYMKALEAE